MKSVYCGLCWLILVVSPYVVWAAQAEKIPASERFQMQLPSESWKQMNTTEGLALRNSAKTGIYLKKDNGSLILVRSGKKADFGISGFFDFASDDAELVYLMKLISSGDYINELKLASKNPLLSHAKAYSFAVQDDKLGTATNLAVILRGGDIVLIELVAGTKNFDTDKDEFYKFLDNLAERKAKE